jgi:hypothetical protein
MVNIHVPKLSLGATVLFFGLGPFFLLVALSLTWQVVTAVLTASEAQSWMQVEATVDTVELRHHPSDDGEGSYSVKVAYRYPWQGQELHGSRVSFRVGAAGPKAEYALFNGLEEARVQSRTVPCWVNPKNPNQAVLDRASSSVGAAGPLVGALVLGLAGAGMVFSGLRASRRQRE